MATENLQVRIIGRDDGAARALQDVATASKRSFLEIQQDVQRAGADFRSGKISVQDYTTAMEFARREAMALSGAMKPAGIEAQAFNRVMRTTGEGATHAGHGAAMLRGSLGSLAFTTAGLPGVFGQLSAILSSFAVGSLAGAGIFAGLAAIGMAFRKITEDSREAKESLEKFVAASVSMRALQESATAGAAEARRAEIIGLLQGGATVSAGGGATAQVPLAGPVREALTQELFGLNRALGDYAKKTDRTAEEIKRLNTLLGNVGRPMPMGPPMAEVPTALLPMVERSRMRSGGSMFDLDTRMRDRTTAAVEARLTQFDRGPRTGETALAARGDINQLLTAAGMTTADLIPSLRRAVLGLDEVGNMFADVGEGVKQAGHQLVGALAMGANALAGLVTGRSSPLGALGGIFGGLSALPALAGMATPLGVASIGFSFLDALTSNDSRDTMKSAHLDALRAFEKEKPAANIYVNIDPFDPTNRRHQRLVDEARRESQASGYTARVNP